MTVHSLHIFDRKGTTLFTKCYAKYQNKNQDPAQLAEQRKLVFGMLFSLREVAASLSPTTAKEDASIHSVQTGASTLYSYESNSGLRFALYMANTVAAVDAAKSIRASLSHIYHEIWINHVIRSPLYIPTEPNVAATGFEQHLDTYLATQSWFR